MWLVSIAGGVLKPLSRFAASFGRKKAPYVIAKKRSDCGNLNLSVGRAAYLLRSAEIPQSKSEWSLPRAKSNGSGMAEFQKAAQPPPSVSDSRLSHVAVGTPVARCPPHRSVREELPHTAPTLSTWRQSECRDKDGRYGDVVSIVFADDRGSYGGSYGVTSFFAPYSLAELLKRCGENPSRARR